jgi:hypothetical protein
MGQPKKIVRNRITKMYNLAKGSKCAYFVYFKAELSAQYRNQPTASNLAKNYFRFQTKMNSITLVLLKTNEKSLIPFEYK